MTRISLAAATTIMVVGVISTATAQPAPLPPDQFFNQTLIPGTMILCKVYADGTAICQSRQPGALPFGIDKDVVNSLEKLPQ